MVTKEASKWFKKFGPDVVEMYSPPRIVQEAGLRCFAGKRLRPGWSLDLTVDDPETGKPWDLSDGKIRSKARELIKHGKPYRVVCSPMCTAFSQMQNINKNRRDPAVIKRELDEAKDHIRFAISICAAQLRENRYFMFEHPDGASSWEMPEVKKLMASACVETVNFDMCAFGMTAVGEDAVRRPVQKSTRVLTNSPEVALRLSRRCPNRSQDKEHHHIHCKLEGGQRCKRAQVYPRALCRAMRGRGGTEASRQPKSGCT